MGWSGHTWTLSTFVLGLFFHDFHRCECGLLCVHCNAFVCVVVLTRVACIPREGDDDFVSTLSWQNPHLSDWVNLPFSSSWAITTYESLFIPVKLAGFFLNCYSNEPLLFHSNLSIDWFKFFLVFFVQTLPVGRNLLLQTPEGGTESFSGPNGPLFMGSHFMDQVVMLSCSHNH